MRPCPRRSSCYWWAIIFGAARVALTVPTSDYAFPAAGLATYADAGRRTTSRTARSACRTVCVAAVLTLLGHLTENRIEVTTDLTGPDVIECYPA
jgi:hypothetical protein